MPEQSGIFYSDQGKGFPILLVHGFCETHEIWNAFTKELSKKYRVLCIDLPGFGKSELLMTPFSITQVGEKVLMLLRSLEINSCIAIGHSLGGYVILAMAEQEPNSFRAFGLFHSTAYADSEERRISRNKVIEFVSKHGVAPFIESFIPPLFYDQSNPAIQKVVNLAKQTSSNALIGYVQAMRDRPDRTHVLQHFKRPTLFLTGEKDGGISVESVKQQASLASKPIVHVLPEIAHMGMFENEQQTLELLSAFVAGIG